MITMNLIGGTGNQLFQWALGRSLAQSGQSVEYATEQLDNDPARCYMLDTFGLDLALTKRGSSQNQRVDEGSLLFKPWILQLRGNYVLRGYWQCEKYFERVQDEIRHDLFCNIEVSPLTSTTSSAIRNEPNSAFLHVRRSDYLSAHARPYHGLMGMDYYQACMERVKSQAPNAHFFIFSDDPAWCHAAFANLPNITVLDHNSWSGTVDTNGIITKHPGGRECEDLWLMSLCKHGIVANSSFSWWGAWLNPLQNDRIVIAPKTWFVTDQVTAADIVPERWSRL